MQGDHLKASVNELDMPEQLVRAAIKAGHKTIESLDLMIDANEKTIGGLEELLKINSKQVKVVIVAVSKYRRKQRKAMAQVEKGGLE